MKDFKNLDPSDYWKILWRRRWYALAGFMLVSVGVGIYSWRKPDIYESQSTISVEPAAILQDYVRPSDRSSPEQQIAGIRQQVQSRTYLLQLIQEFGLFDYRPDEKFPMESAIQALSNNIKVINVSRNVFTISYASTNAFQAQSVTKRIVDTLIQSNSSSRKNKALETDQFLDEQLRQTEQDLLAQEEKIKQFKMAHLGELPEQSSANMNVLNGLNTQLAMAENALKNAKDQQKLIEFRAQEQKRLNLLTSSLLTPSTQSSPAKKVTQSAPKPDPLLEAKEAELAQLTLRYTPNHPDVVRLTREVEELRRKAQAKHSPEPTTALGETKSVEEHEEDSSASDITLDVADAEIKLEAEAVKSEIAKREKERDAILAQIKIYQNRLNLAPALEQQYMSLSREHDVLKGQYESLKSKKFQAQMTADAETDRNNDTYKVIDEANLPEKPSFPDRKQIFLIGLGAGFIVGIGAAFGRELLDTTLGGEEEVAAVLKLPVLATVSEIPKKQPRKLIGTVGTQKSA
jgi:succinoglycan biosynthesis transport protein ExoP